jgi:dihydrofolate reductase
LPLTDRADDRELSVWPDCEEHLPHRVGGVVQGVVVKTQYYTASSIDGFIADRDNSLGWLVNRDVEPGGPMAIEHFMADVGAMAMGATTYQWVLDNGPWDYSIPCWVFTHRDFAATGADVRFTQDDVESVHAEMAETAGSKNVWLVGGGGLVGQFADRGLLDELWVQYAPVTLGAGAPLLPRRLEFALAEVARDRDFTCARYTVVP